MKNLIAVFLIAIGALIALAAYGYHYEKNERVLAQPVTIIFESGQGFKVMSDTLAQMGVIEKPALFKAIALFSGKARKFKAGEYYFPAFSTPEEVMNLLVSGKVIIHKFTAAEGLTSQAIVALLKAEPTLTGDIEEPVAEGSLLPQTYNFTYGNKRQDIIRRMQADMNKTLSELWQARKTGLPFTTPQEALTLASIVEKETGIEAERGHVASVFINRLRQGMKLQSDPTTAYGLQKSGMQLSSADLQTSTPYNTYVINGLPPGPICNPGKASIEAVLNPPDTNDLYFVATGSGGHNFSATLAQHEKNVAAYRAAVKKP